MRCSLTQAEVTWRRVLLARAIPVCTASSKLFVERALISETFATEPAAPFALMAMVLSFSWWDVSPSHGFGRTAPFRDEERGPARGGTPPAHTKSEKSSRFGEPVPGLPTTPMVALFTIAWATVAALWLPNSDK